MKAESDQILLFFQRNQDGRGSIGIFDDIGTDIIQNPGNIICGNLQEAVRPADMKDDGKALLLQIAAKL